MQTTPITLTAAQYDILNLAIIDGGIASGYISYSNPDLRWLDRNGLIVYRVTSMMWFITEAGRAAHAPITVEAQ